MQEVSRQEVIDSLRQVGIARGDGLLVHSALQFLGRPASGVGMYLDAVDAVVGLTGSEGLPSASVAVITVSSSLA